ncbi:protocadherin Fat 2-like isoform X2 [Mytilus californianus]|uniref:protocadherin Fat 2-like isoform X2 n=1 Tax=Mytilus californianus TaxID=6549 RepID=UPI002247A644|nr:protocadherin Fat 2-like isoform X2 [Mytilus californianus]
MILLIYLCLFTQVVTVLTAVCGDSTIGMADPPSTYSGNIDSNSNTAYVMTDAAVEFSCCGMIKTWKFYASRSGTIKLQVWRTWFNTNFTLVGENTFVVPVEAVNQEIHYEVAEEHRIQINNNDYIGWYTTGTDIIPYSGGARPDNTYYISTSVSVDSTYPFTSNYDNRVYAIVAVVTANKKPYFDNIPSQIHVFDHLAINDVVWTLDPKDTENDDITVSLSQTNTYFKLSTNAIKVKSSLSTTNSFAVALDPQITDSCGVSESITLRIIVENEKPIITSLPTSVEISENNEVETLLHTITAVDGETLTCELHSVLPFSNDTVFEVKQTSTPGEYGIYYVYIPRNRSLDYDSVVRYDVSVTCTDGRQPSDEGHLMVYVIKNIPPEFTDLPREEILPQQSTSSGFIVPIVVTDADTATTSLSYAITCEPSASCPFSRTTTSTGADIKTTVDFSTIQVPAFDIHVTVNDGDTTVGPKVLSIYVENINDIPVFANAESDLKIGVEENTAIDTLLYTYFTTDLDSVDVVTYSWTPTTNTYFDIDSARSDTEFKFVVKATDTKDTATTTVTISIVNVNDVPTLSNTHYVINDTENLGETLLSSPNIDASDPENETLRYTLDCNGYNTTYFEMDESTGDVYFGRDFDSDIGHPPVTECNVTVTDPGGLTDTAFLTINIADTNDFTPEFERDFYNVFLFPTEDIGTILINVSASDGDITETWNIISYGMDQSGLGNSYFNIDENGTISVAMDISAAFDYGQTVILTLSATDGGGLQGFATLSLIFPETTTTSTTTTERPFKTETYPDNGYWYLFAGIVLMMNTVLIINLCMKYCRPCTDIDKRTESQKRDDRIKAAQERKTKVRSDFFSTDDPWSVNRYQSRKVPEKQDPAPAINRKTKRSDEKSVNSLDQASQGTTNANRSSMESFDSSSTSKNLFPYNQQSHHIFNPKTGRTGKRHVDQKSLW